MGKKNPAQRTKGNAKPSSSGRAAELLSTSAAPVYSFGFGGGLGGASSALGVVAGSNAENDASTMATTTTTPMVIPTVAAIPLAVPTSTPFDDESGDASASLQLDGDVRLLLKKMTKKDSITKSKALTEFIACLESKGLDDIKALIPFWPRIYNALSMDSDRKVRELTQQAMLQLVQPERKKLLAPHLKMFLGAWMLALVDSYAPAASAAARAFDAAFTKDKQIEAVRFCAKEIFFYLKDILLDQSPETLSDPKATPKDEMEAKYERVVSSSLSALNSLVESLDERDAHISHGENEEEPPQTPKDAGKLDQDLATLLTNKKMLKLSIHSNPSIRSAWFSVVATVTARRPRLVKDKLAAPFASCVLNRFEETDPIVVAAFWNAVMTVLKVVENPWSHVNLRKAVLPKLFQLMRSGCGGSSVLVGPHIVVLVSFLPDEIIGAENSARFYEELSSSIQEAIDKGSKSFQSPSESAALILSSIECLQLLLFRDCVSPTVELTTETLADAASDAVPTTDPASTLKSRTALMNEVVKVLQTGISHKNARQILSVDFFRVLENILTKSGQIFEGDLERTFWDGFGRSTTETARANGDSLRRLVDVLKCRPEVAARQSGEGGRKGVGFDMPETERRSIKKEVRSEPRRLYSSLKNKMLEELKESIFHLLEKEPSVPRFNLFCEICKNHSNEDFLRRRFSDERSEANREGEDENHDDARSVECLEKVWRPLREKLVGDLWSIEVETNLAYLLKSLTFNDNFESTSLESLESFVEKVNEPLFYRVLLEDTCRVGRTSGCSKKWIDSASVATYLTKAIEAVIDGDDRKIEFESLVTFALKSGKLNAKCLERIIELLVDRLAFADSRGEKGNASAKFANVIFLNYPRFLDLESGRSLHLRVLELFFDERVKNEAADSVDLEAACESGLIAARDCVEHIAAIGKMLRSRIPATETGEKNMVSVVSKICSLIVGHENAELRSHKIVVFLGNIFGQHPLEYVDAVCNLWLPQAIIANAVFLDEIYLITLSKKYENSNFTVKYLRKLSLFSQIVIEMNLTLMDIPATPDCHEILSVLAEVSFALKLIDSSPLTLQASNSNPEMKSFQTFFIHLKKIFSTVLDNILPTGIGASADREPVNWNHISDLTKILWTDGVIGDTIQNRYGCLCRLNLISFFESKRSNSSTNFLNVLPRLLNLDYLPDANVLGRRICKGTLGNDNDSLVVLSNDASRADSDLPEVLAEIVSFEIKSDESSPSIIPLSANLFGHKQVASKLSPSIFVDTIESDYVATFPTVLSRLIGKKSTFIEQLLSCTDVSEVTWPVLQFNVNFMSFLTSLVSPTEPSDEKSFDHLTKVDRNEWDFIFCSTLGWTQSLCESTRHLEASAEGEDALKALVFFKACCDLVATISRLFCPRCRPFSEGSSTLASSLYSFFNPSASSTSPIKSADYPWLTLSTRFDDSVATPKVPWDKGESKGPAEEWTGSFEDAIFAILISAYVKFIENSLTTITTDAKTIVSFYSRSICAANVAASFRGVLECCIPDKILSSEDLDISAKLLADDAASSLPPHIQSLFNCLTSSLVSPLVDVQLTSYHLLLRLLPAVTKAAEEDFAKESARSSNDEGWSPPSALGTLFDSAQTAFEFLVDGIAVGEMLRIDSDDLTHSYVLSYVLAWNALRRLLTLSTPELRAQFAFYLRDAIPTLLRHLSFLLPDCLVESRPNTNAGRVATVARLPQATIFGADAKEDADFVLINQDPILPPRTNAFSSSSEVTQHLGVTNIGANFYVSSRGQTPSWNANVARASVSAASRIDPLKNLHGLAGATFVGTFRDLPASVRQWWTDADKKTSTFVERVSAHHISPVLSARELNSVADEKSSSTNNLENITVKVRPQSREVVALYTMDEITMELLIKVPANFPLGQIAVECGRRVGEVKEQKRWMLQLTTFLRHQNGSIVDGIAMWKKNIDKPFEGVDPCMVCFSVLHSSNYQLPKLTCKACKKKFHSVCLYKWFSTSNNSSCPLCRSLF